MIIRQPLAQHVGRSLRLRSDVLPTLPLCRLHTSAPRWEQQREPEAEHEAGGNDTNPTGARNIFLEADEEEETVTLRQGLLDRQREEMARQPAWQGEELVQDTIKRMLMDKYQPLRIHGQSNASSSHPADAKMGTIQKPAAVLATSRAAVVTAEDGVDVAATVVDVEALSVHEDGRRLAKTPDNKPWRAVYVNPMLRGNSEAPSEGSIYYARYLGMPAVGAGRKVPKTASGKEKLKLAGIRPEALPLDDRNKMRAIREGVRRWDRAGRMRGVKEEAMQYRRMRQEELEAGNVVEEELERLNVEGVLQEGQEMRLSSASDSKRGEGQVAMTGGRGFQSLANERIEAAMKTDYFRRNSLRGKPLVKDIHSSNPFLSGEERIMNRLIQRQGAAPPWVELNVQLENEQADFRRRLADSWLRRASRMILATDHLRAGLASLTIQPDEDFDRIVERDTLSAGQRRLLHLSSTYVDPEWEQKEQAYHEVGLRDVNNLIRRYNVVAPVSARRGLLLRPQELERVRKVNRTELARRLSDGLRPAVSSATSSGTTVSRSSGVGTSGLFFGSWRRSDAQTAKLGPEDDMTVGRAARTLHGGEGQGGEGADGGPATRTKRSDGSLDENALAALLRRTALKARQIVSW